MILFGRGRDSAILNVMSAPQSKANGGAVAPGVYLLGAMAVDASVTCATGHSTLPERSSMGCNAARLPTPPLATLAGSRTSDARALQTLLATATERKCGHRHKPRRGEVATPPMHSLPRALGARWARAMVVEARCHTASNGAVPLRPACQKCYLGAR